MNYTLMHVQSKRSMCLLLRLLATISNGEEFFLSPYCVTKSLTALQPPGPELL